MVIEPEHFKYLSIQRGEVSSLRGDRKEWQVALEDSLQRVVEQIAPRLPAPPRRVLDIGGGLGALVVKLRHACPAAHYTIIDGTSDSPEVVSHCQTFSHRRVALDFLEKNGVQAVEYLAPWEFNSRQHAPFDLVVSTAAYGFHIPPGNYIHAVRESVRPGSLLVFDVRSTKRHWLEEFVLAFGTPVVLHRAQKYVRLAWTVMS